MRQVQTNLLLYKETPISSLEEAQEEDLRTLHKGMHFLNMCIQLPGAGDGPTSVVF